VKFAALVEHDSIQNQPPRTTKFLALDKCLPKRDFMQIVDFPEKNATDGFSLDPEWLSILRSNHGNHPLMDTRNVRVCVSPDIATARHREWVEAKLRDRQPVAPFPFAVTAPSHLPSDRREPGRGTPPTSVLRNPQTVALMELLELEFTLDSNPRGPSPGSNQRAPRLGFGFGPPPPPPPPPPPKLFPPPGASSVSSYPIPREGPFGSLVPRHLPPPPRVKDFNEINLEDDVDDE
jgi:lariat debranching enzyme